MEKGWCLPCTWTEKRKDGWRERRKDGWREGDPRAVQRIGAELVSQLLGDICALSLIAVGREESWANTTPSRVLTTMEATAHGWGSLIDCAL